jgi:hypothetical protein
MTSSSALGKASETHTCIAEGPSSNSAMVKSHNTSVATVTYQAIQIKLVALQIAMTMQLAPIREARCAQGIVALLDVCTAPSRRVSIVGQAPNNFLVILHEESYPQLHRQRRH